MALDTSFNFDEEVGADRDADTASPTLRHYHQLLWSKQVLRDGRSFPLVIRGSRLHHNSELGTFEFTSDAIATSLAKQLAKRDVMRYISADEIGRFKAINATIGGRILFPAKKIGGKNNINGARGMDHRICDRFDLTLECIRRHYVGEWSPLSEVLGRYGNFFAVFGDFRGYVEFFVLHDLVTDDASSVRFFLAFDEFRPWPLPLDRASYTRFREATVAFVEARNARIRVLAEDLVLPEILRRSPRARGQKAPSPLPLLEHAQPG
jgi:hypothetical protein